MTDENATMPTAVDSTLFTTTSNTQPHGPSSHVGRKATSKRAGACAGKAPVCENTSGDEVDSKVKSPNFTEEISMLIVELFIKFEPQLCGSKSKELSCGKKKKIWMDMAAVVNANSDCKRDWLQVRKRIYDMKRSIKTKMDKAKKEASKTGSGKSEHIEYTPSEQRLLSVIKNASLHGVGGHDTSALLVTSKPQSLPHVLPPTSKDPAEGTVEPTEEELYFEDMQPGTSTQQEEVVYSGSLLANSFASEAEDTNLTQPNQPRGELGSNFIAMEANYEGETEGEVYLNLEPVACPFQDVQDIPDISHEPLVYLLQSGESHDMSESSSVSCGGSKEKGKCVPVRKSFTQPAQSRRERDSTQGAKGGTNYRAAAEVAFKEQTQMVDFARRQCVATESIAQSMKDISSFLCISHTQLLERVHNIDTKFGLLVEKLSGVPLPSALPADTSSPEESEALSAESNRVHKHPHSKGAMRNKTMRIAPHQKVSPIIYPVN